MSPLLSGGLIGFGQALQKISSDWTAERLEGLRQENADRRQQALLNAAAMRQEAGFKHDKDMIPVQSAARLNEQKQGLLNASSPEVVEAQANAANQKLDLTRDARTRDAVETARVQTESEVKAFEALAPLKQKATIDSAVAVLQAQSTPEMIAATRRIAQAKHIVDPSFTAVPQADGTVMMVNARNPSAPGVLLKGEDGRPVVKRDSEGMRAATSIINMANTNLRIAQAEHKAAVADTMATPAAKAAADAAWKAAQEEARRLTAPAYAVLFGKAKIPDGEAASTTRTPSGTGARSNSSTGDSAGSPPLSSFSRAPAPGTFIEGYTFKGGNPNDRKNWEAPERPPTTRDDPLQIRDPFKPSGGLLGTGVPELVAPTEPPSPKARSQQARDELVTRQAESEKDRAADTFRSILQVGRFLPSDRWLIELALQTGKLSEAETRTAHQMLDQLRK